MTVQTSSRTFFEAKYTDSPDPWRFATSPYENARYDRTIEALGNQRFLRAFEPGCSIGVLTERLAPHCNEIEATDISATAVELAQERCRFAPHVRIRQGAFPDEIPSGPFDLLILSEIGYYFEVPELREALLAVREQLASQAVLLAVHWLGHSKDHRIGGDAVHQQISELSGLQHEFGFRHLGAPEESYRLDRWMVP